MAQQREINPKHCKIYQGIQTGICKTKLDNLKTDFYLLKLEYVYSKEKFLFFLTKVFMEI